MNRTLATRFAFASLLLATLWGCGSKCDGSNCGGCCSADGICEVPSDSACGEGGATCTACDAIQACLSGVCVLQSQSNGTNSTTSSTSSTASSNSSGTTASTSPTTSTGTPTTSTGTTNADNTTGQSSGTTGQSTTTATSTTGSPTIGTSSTLTTGSPGTSLSSSSGTAAGTTTTGTTGTTGTSTTTGTSSSSSGTTGNLPICSPCTANTQCASDFCNNAAPPGFCDTTDQCNPAGGDAAVNCSPYTCGANGDCVCPGVSTASSSTTGASGSTGTSSCADVQTCLFCTVLGQTCDPVTCTCPGLTGGLNGTTGLAGTLGSGFGTTGTGASGGSGTTGGTGACPDTEIQLTGPGSNVDVSGDTVNQTYTLTSSCDEAGVGAPLVGYTFTLTETTDVFATATTSTAGFSPLLSLGTGCSDGNFTEQYCSTSLGAETTFIGVNLAPGTYELLVSGDDSDTVTSGPYVLHAWAETNEAPPANDVCGGATPLSLATFADGGMGASIQVNNFWADNTTTTSETGQCLGNGRGPNVVYSIDLPSAASGITATVLPGDDGGLNEPVVSIQDSPCQQNNSTDAGTLSSELACGDWTMAGGAVAHATGNVRPGTYYIWVDEYDTGVPGEGTLEVTVP